MLMNAKERATDTRRVVFLYVKSIEMISIVVEGTIKTFELGLAQLVTVHGVELLEFEFMDDSRKKTRIYLEMVEISATIN